MELIWTRAVDAGIAPAAAEVEARLIAASRSGDGDAFGDLVRLHQHRIFRLAGRFFRRREDVEEVAQETFLIAWRKLATYEARAPFEHWLTRLCLNCCYARLRRSRPPEESIGDRNPAGPSRDPDAALEVQKLLRPLDPRDRFILLLLDGEGWTTAEIAERLGWSRVNVKVRAHRARRRLRALLEKP